MVKKSEFIWNTIGSFISAILNAVLLLFCTRINGTEIAGIFSISFATAIILNAIGDFGIRIYQVTDTNRKYTFEDYLMSRIIAITIMVVIGIIFVICSGYDVQKLTITMLLILFKVIDNLSESYQAEFQINNRLDLGGKSIIIRNCFSMLGFVITDLITKNIILSCITLVVTNMLFYIIYDKKLIKKFVVNKSKINLTSVKHIIKECLPLGLSTLLSMYITNAVKYAIDANKDYDMQTYYNIIYLPTFIINLVSLFVIKPVLKPLGDYWNSNKHKEFMKVILKISGIIFVSTLLIELICSTIALPILTILYGVDLSMYKKELIILVASGFFYAMATLMFYALSTVRKQKQTTIGYAITALFSIVLPYFLVKKYNMMGVAISNLMITILLFFILFVFLLKAYYSKNTIKTKNKEI